MDAFATVSPQGLPAQPCPTTVSCFTGRLSPAATGFERTLRRPGHPPVLFESDASPDLRETRTFPSDTKRWLARQPPARNEDELQTLLDRWRHFYNTQRPHCSLAGATPYERWAANPAARPGDPILDPPDTQLRRVDPTGVARWKNYTLGIGIDYAGHNILIVVRDHHHLKIYGPNSLQRDITIDPTRRYQPSGLPPGRRRKMRQQ